MSPYATRHIGLASRLLAPPKGLRVAHWYATVSLVGFLLVVAWPSLFGLLALPSGGSLNWRTFTGVVTHPFVPPSAWGWAWPAAFVYLSAYLLQRHLDDLKQLYLFSAGLLVGGTTLLLTSRESVAFVGGGLPAWSYSAAAVVLGVKEWHSLRWPWRVFVIWVGLSLVLRGMDFSNPQRSLSAAAIAGAVLVTIWSRGWLLTPTDGDRPRAV